jgi:hypothetical protein
VGPGRARRRRSLRYIRLAAYLAAEPEGTDRLKLSVRALEAIVGEPLPAASRFPSWWRNDATKAHARAWLTAGWRLAEVDLRRGVLVFERSARHRAGGREGGRAPG